MSFELFVPGQRSPGSVQWPVRMSVVNVISIPYMIFDYDGPLTHPLPFPTSCHLATRTRTESCNDNFAKNVPRLSRLCKSDCVSPARVLRGYHLPAQSRWRRSAPAPPPPPPAPRPRRSPPEQPSSRCTAACRITPRSPASVLLAARGPSGALILRARVNQRAIKAMTKTRNSPAATPMMACWTGRGP